MLIALRTKIDISPDSRTINQSHWENILFSGHNISQQKRTETQIRVVHSAARGLFFRHPVLVDSFVFCCCNTHSIDLKPVAYVAP